MSLGSRTHQICWVFAITVFGGVTPAAIIHFTKRGFVSGDGLKFPNR